MKEEIGRQQAPLSLENTIPASRSLFFLSSSPCKTNLIHSFKSIEVEVFRAGDDGARGRRAEERLCENRVRVEGRGHANCLVRDDAVEPDDDRGRVSVLVVYKGLEHGRMGHLTDGASREQQVFGEGLVGRGGS